jgi:ribosomal protein S6--L-glutamate ligase
MRIALLGSPTSWYTHDLQRAAADAHSIVPVDYGQLQSELAGEGACFQAGETNLAETDCLLVRSMPPGSLEQIVFRMDILGQLASCGLPVVNGPRAIETAVDKYLATARLQAAGLKVPRTVVCQTVDEALHGFHALGRDVVVKPLFGSEGRGILRVSDEALAWRTFQTLARLDRVLYLQRFIAHGGSDLRLLVLGERVLGIRRTSADDWRTNISRGAVAEPLRVTPELEELARRAAAAVGATLAGVDLLPGSDGHLYALEVNAVPGWQALATATGIDVASLVIEHLGQACDTV